MRKVLMFVVIAAVAAAAQAQQVNKTLPMKFGRDAQVGPPAVTAIDGSAIWSEIEAAVCAHYGYVEQVQVYDANGQPVLDAQGNPTYQANPESKAVFVRKVVKKFLLEHRQAYLDEIGARQGLAAARASRAAETETP